jgi:hypothetical protein
LFSVFSAAARGRRLIGFSLRLTPFWRTSAFSPIFKDHQGAQECRELADTVEKLSGLAIALLLAAFFMV